MLDIALNPRDPQEITKAVLMPSSESAPSVFTRPETLNMTEMGRRMGKISSLDAFFRPRSVAIVGRPLIPRKWEYCAQESCVHGIQGKVFPISPREESILGFRCYKNMLEIPEPVDLFLLVSAELTISG